MMVMASPWGAVFGQSKLSLLERIQGRTPMPSGFQDTVSSAVWQGAKFAAKFGTIAAMAGAGAYGAYEVAKRTIPVTSQLMGENYILGTAQGFNKYARNNTWINQQGGSPADQVSQVAGSFTVKRAWG